MVVHPPSATTELCHSLLPVVLLLSSASLFVLLELLDLSVFFRPRSAGVRSSQEAAITGHRTSVSNRRPLCTNVKESKIQCNQPRQSKQSRLVLALRKKKKSLKSN